MPNTLILSCCRNVYNIEKYKSMRWSSAAILQVSRLVLKYVPFHCKCLLYTFYVAVFCMGGVQITVESRLLNFSNS